VKGDAAVEVRASRHAVALAVAAIVLAFGNVEAAEGESAFKMIVNPSVAGQKVARDVIGQIYLGKVSRWADGRPIVAADLSSTSAVRAAFSTAVLGMPVEKVKSHWLRSASAGHRPPTTRASDAEMIEFVAGTTGAIGYVSARTPVPPTVRVVSVE
jgi:ABC-type phosphate transport system substrate-binding protein